jgi:MarR-like DNA-binding transcriptional regulator SgrR of sgrS sRNA
MSDPLTVPIRDQKLAEQLADVWARNGIAVEIKKISARRWVLVEA